MSLKKDEEWEKILTPEQFRVCRQKGTEEVCLIFFNFTL